MPGGKPYTNLRRILNFNRRQTRNVALTQGTSINRLDYKISLPYSCFRTDLSAYDAIHLTLIKVSGRDATVNQTRPFFSATTNKNGKKRFGNARLGQLVPLLNFLWERTPRSLLWHGRMAMSKVIQIN